MKVKIARGSASIEIEGDFSEVERVLDRWWASEPNDDADDAPPSEEDAGEADNKKPRRAPRRPARTPRTTGGGNKDGFDADAVANRMKEDPRYEVFVSKVILTPKGREEKVKLVSWFEGETPLTTGNVHRVLHRLGVKLDASNVSRAMTGDAKHDYMVDRSGTYPTYKLSAPARAKFERWLFDDARKA